MSPKYDLDKIKFATDRPTFERATGLYESGRVKRFKTDGYVFSGLVQGSKPYEVVVSPDHYDRGSCECYLGQNDELCKHMVAVAIYAVKGGQPLTDEEKSAISEPVCGGRLGELSVQELAEAKNEMSEALRHIKPYNGPSKIWFAYQNSLSEGCNRIAKLVSELPTSRQTAELLVNLLLRMERKLGGGVDDSDGTVGGCIEGIVHVLLEYAELDPKCTSAFKVLQSIDTSFGWEEPLVL